MLFLSVLIQILHFAISANQTETWGKKYDFVIVGGGTAGCVLASRLSEIKDWKVLLLEAGQQPPLLSVVPSAAQNLQLTTYNWGYLTEPQKNIFKGMNNRRMLWSSGRVLGGGSSINYMIYEKGNPKDWNIKNWSFKDVSPYFQKSLMSVELAHSSDNSISFLQAGKEMGFNITKGDQIGFSHLKGTTKSGGRETTANAYLEPYLNRTNLEVVLLAEAVKIQINSTRKKAQAVHFLKGNKTYKVVASKEIILSAGTFNTPKLLMQSGIGPVKKLKELKIKPIIRNLAVGQELRDHVTYPGLNFLTNQSVSQFDGIKNLFLGLPSWYFSGKGPFSSLGNFEAVAFVNVDDPTSKRPNVELLFLNQNIKSVDKAIFNLREEIFEKLYTKTSNVTFSIYATLLHPKSIGKMQLSSDRLIQLYPNYFSHPDDLKTMIKAIKFVLDLVKTPEFRKMGVVLNPNLVPGCESRKNDEYWECAIRTLGTTAYDPFGTCKMGNGTKAVVDDKLKVQGVKSLRVVDASVIPDSLSGRLMAPVIMIAEKGADLIKHAHRK